MSNPLRSSNQAPFLRRSGNNRPVRPPIKKAAPSNGSSTPVVKKEQVDSLEGGKFQDFSIKACTQAELQDVQYHLMKLQQKKDVNPMKDFTKPIRLHRKDPRNMQFQLTLKEIDEREEQNRKLKAEGGENAGIGDSSTVKYEIYLDGEMGTVAPDDGPINVAPDGKRGKNRRRTKEVRAINDDSRKLRYEEYYPWVMEDYDGVNTYVGNYEAASTDGHNHALLVPALNGGFKMIPINKIYKFTPRNKYSTLTIEEAEERLSDRKHIDRWVMSKLEKQDDEIRNNSRQGRRRGLLTTGRNYGDDDRNGRSDNEGMDFDEEFADDEEAPIVGGGDDEEEKDSRKRMEKEMLKANTGLQEKFDDDDDDDDLFNEKKKKFDKEGKKLKKALVKNEFGQVVYESDDDENNPYVSDSDLNTSESDTDVKKEDKSGDNSKTSTPMPHTPVISVRSPGSNPVGIVVFKALSSVLSRYPPGEWNPKVAKKRSLLPEALENGVKKQKLDGTLITKEEISDLIRNNELTTKELYQRLKEKMSKNRSNKEIFKSLIKELAKVRTKEDGTKILLLK